MPTPPVGWHSTVTLAAGATSETGRRYLAAYEAVAWAESRRGDLAAYGDELNGAPGENAWPGGATTRLADHARLVALAKLVTSAERAEAAASMRRLLEAIDRDDLEATDVERAHLEGVLRGLEATSESEGYT